MGQLLHRAELDVFHGIMHDNLEHISSAIWRASETTCARSLSRMFTLANFSRCIDELIDRTTPIGHRLLERLGGANRDHLRPNDYSLFGSFAIRWEVGRDACVTLLENRKFRAGLLGIINDHISPNVFLSGQKLNPSILRAAGSFLGNDHAVYILLAYLMKPTKRRSDDSALRQTALLTYFRMLPTWECVDCKLDRIAEFLDKKQRHNEAEVFWRVQFALELKCYRTSGLAPHSHPHCNEAHYCYCLMEMFKKYQEAHGQDLFFFECLHRYRQQHSYVCTLSDLRDETLDNLFFRWKQTNDAFLGAIINQWETHIRVIARHYFGFTMEDDESEYWTALEDASILETADGNGSEDDPWGPRTPGNSSTNRNVVTELPHEGFCDECSNELFTGYDEVMRCCAPGCDFKVSGSFVVWRTIFIYPLVDMDLVSLSMQIWPSDDCWRPMVL